MFFKLVGVIFIIFSSFFIGYKNYSVWNLRIDFLEQYLFFVKYVEIKIGYEESLLDDIIKSFETKSQCFKEFLKIYVENSHNGKTTKLALLQATNKVSDDLNLLNSTKRIMENFNFSLGCSDVDNQMKMFKLTEEFLRKSIDFYSREKINKGKLHFLISVSVGLVVILLFI